MNATFVPCDVSDAEQPANVIDTAGTKYRGVVVMDNNAGIRGAEGSIFTVQVGRRTCHARRVV